jgi:ADP-dependent NAD(P)H-hydrate dehydratase / NAD(P)H-hydrate epimerase
MYTEIIPSLRDIQGLLPQRPRTAHKGTMGKVLVIAGSLGFSGAAILSSKAVLRSGAGLVSLATIQSLAGLIDVTNLEIMTIPLAETSSGTIASRATALLSEIIPRMDAVLIGPGLSGNSSTQKCIQTLLQFISRQHPRIRVVLDADGLKILKHSLWPFKQPLIITPHLGELAALLDQPVREVERHTMRYAFLAAERFHAVVVAKAHRTLIVKPGSHRYYVVENGNAGMAKGGSGDVLAGLITGLWVSSRLSPVAAATAAAYIHAVAGNIAAHTHSIDGIIASDIITAIPAALKYVKGN